MRKWKKVGIGPIHVSINGDLASGKVHVEKLVNGKVYPVYVEGVAADTDTADDFTLQLGPELKIRLRAENVTEVDWAIMGLRFNL